MLMLFAFEMDQDPQHPHLWQVLLSHLILKRKFQLLPDQFTFFTLSLLKFDSSDRKKGIEMQVGEQQCRKCNSY